jgi:hypothetical protein
MTGRIRNGTTTLQVKFMTSEILFFDADTDYVKKMFISGSRLKYINFSTFDEHGFWAKIYFLSLVLGFLRFLICWHYNLFYSE